MIQWNFKMKKLFSKTLNILSEQTMQHITDKGDSGEDCPVHSIRNVLKNSFGFQSEWDCH